MSHVYHRTLLVLLILVNVASAADWPLWRHDANRSASTEQVLAEQLHLLWSRQFPPLAPAWNEDPRLKFDTHYEPIVTGKTMFVASSHNDSLTAIDVDTGRDRWKFFADGPIRFAPVAWQQRVIFGSDDGCCYCLDAITGKVIWKFNGAPSGRLAIGNERLISVWPVRTGPVLASDGQLYFTVGVWPFEGTLLYCLDPVTGKQVHVADLRDQAPQGYLVAADDNLYIPCGRSSAYGMRLGSYEPLRLNYKARGTSDYHVTCDGKHLFHGDKIISVAASNALPLDAHRPVMHDGEIYFTHEGVVHAYDLDEQMEVESTNRRGEKVLERVPRPLWKLGVPATIVHMRAGNRLYAHHEQFVFAIDLPETGEDSPQVSWRAEIDGQAASMLAADNKLYVVTEQGVIHCFQSDAREAQSIPLAAAPMPIADQSAAATAHSSSASMQDGYCLVLGVGDGKLIDALVQKTQYHVIVIDPDDSRVSDLRKRMDGYGKYGNRVVARAAHVESLQFPPYMASLITSGDMTSSGLGAPESFARQVFSALRPYGGAASFQVSEAQHEAIRVAVEASDLSNAILQRRSGVTSLTRSGALPGSGDWTHEYGDPANTLMSQDKLVKAPLGVLWFGGPSADGRLYYDRHDWAPSMAVIEGRMFIQGPQSFTAVDVYTGRILWQKQLPAGISPGRRSNWDASGYHYVADKDAIYLTFPDKCLRLAPGSGEVLSELRLPDETSRWGRIRLWNDLLIVPAFSKLQDDSEARPLTVFALNKQTGAEVWTMRSKLGFPLMAIGNDIVYCYEGKLSGLYRGDSEKRRGGVPVRASDELAVLAMRVSTGEELWTKSYAEPVSWLSFSEDHDVVLISNRNGMEAVDGSSGESLWSKQSTGQGFKGHPENYWDRLIIWKDQLLDQRGPGLAYNIRTGDNVAQTNPLTGEQVDWQFTKVGHHCNYAIASEFLMTFRADTAGFCDIATGETARLNGFRPGCRNSLIPANGVLNAPNYGHGCVCSYSVFTSLALVHVPESEAWTYSAHKLDQGIIKQLGLNLGAPGDRRAENGTLWLDYPDVGGPSPKVSVTMVGQAETFRRHPATISGDGPSWISASGVTGIESLTITLNTKGREEASADRTCTVWLVFAEPAEITTGSRVFDVEIQGDRVITGLDVSKEAGGPLRTLVKTIKGVKVRDSVTIDFAARKGSPLICGVEVIVDDETVGP